MPYYIKFINVLIVHPEDGNVEVNNTFAPLRDAVSATVNVLPISTVELSIYCIDEPFHVAIN
jgi:hypothetical protein